MSSSLAAADFFNDFFYLLIYSFIIIIIKSIFCLNFSFRYVLQNWHINSLKFDCIKTAANAPLTKAGGFGYTGIFMLPI